MSSKTATGTRVLTRTHLILLLVLGVCTAFLQVAFPWASLRLGDLLAEQHGLDNFLSARLKLYSLMDFRDFLSSNSVNFNFVSAAICDQEAHILLKEVNTSSVSRVKYLRINLLTGRTSESRVPIDVRHVVSDGKQVWLIPSDDFDDVDSPFVLSGRPVGIVRSGRNRMRLREFVNGHWRNTDIFAIIPTPYTSHINSQSPYVSYGQGEISVISYADAQCYFHASLGTGTKQELTDFASVCGTSVRQITESSNCSIGWAKFAMPAEIPFGHGIENGQPCFFEAVYKPNSISEFEATVKARLKASNDIQVDDDVPKFQIGASESVENSKPQTDGILVYHPNSDGNFDKQFVECINEWSDDVFGACKGGHWMHAIACGDRNTFILSYAPLDSVVKLFRLHGREFRFIASSRQGLIHWVTLDAILCYSLAVAIPTILLALVAWRRERGSCLEFSLRNTKVFIASIARRGCARAIDISIRFALSVSSAVLHPEAFGWWCHLNYQLEHLRPDVSGILLSPTWEHLIDIQENFLSLLSNVLAAPFVPWTVAIFVAVSLAQIMMQGNTGKTIGKWVFGIKVVRTTLKPCGFARSLLRELLLLVDSTGMFFWFPGVACIISTRSSQRIGDLMSDTIVVCDGECPLSQGGHQFV